MRLIRAIVVGCRAEPSLNAWYDGHAVGRRVLSEIHLGIAVDTDDGLFVPVLRDVGNRDPDDLRLHLDSLKQAVRKREIPPDELRGHTFILSNFGVFGGCHANPVVMPPTVGILAGGRIRPCVVPAHAGPAIHGILPVSCRLRLIIAQSRAVKRPDFLPR